MSCWTSLSRAVTSASRRARSSDAPRIDLIDPDRATPAGDGIVRAPILELAEALARYG
jgi:hypothetical protein